MDADVVIVGCGPAGIFSALELCEKSNLNILMIDKGRDLPKRSCPAYPKERCTKGCKPCPRSCGWGGAGAFSDGKLHLSTGIGGWLLNYRKEKELSELLKYVDSIFLRFGAPAQLYGEDASKVEEIQRRATLAGMRLSPSIIRHLGTDRCFKILRKMEEYLRRKKVQIKTDTRAERLLVGQEGIRGIQTYENRDILSKYVIVAPGRGGSSWLDRELETHGLISDQNPVDLGIRVEVPAYVMEHLTDVLFEPKLEYFSKKFDDRVRVFCVCPNGEVITELNSIGERDIVTVNGQGFSHKISENTNFAILVSTKFTEPFDGAQRYAANIADLANLLGFTVLVQRLGDLEKGRRSTDDRIRRSIVRPTLKAALPGDLAFVLPYRYLADILEMLYALDKVAPGIADSDTLLYALEVKFYSSKPQLSLDFETKIPNLFAAGDGVGISRGLLQASASGVITAQAILKREMHSNVRGMQ